jgi:hypothetical protein
MKGTKNKKERRTKRGIWKERIEQNKGKWKKGQNKK